MRRFVFLLMLVLALSACTFASNQGYAADVNAVATGNWVSPSTWNTGVPTSSDYAYIDGGYTVSIAGTDAAVATIVRLANADDQQTGYLSQDGGSITSAYLQVGYLGKGTYTLNDGTVSLTKHILVGSGTNANGAVNQLGGAITTAEDVVVGKYGTGAYNMSGGTLDTGSFIALGHNSATASGTITQSGGTISSPDDIFVGLSGTGKYTMTGGAYNGTGTGSDLLMGYYGYASGTFNQDAGTVTLGVSVVLGHFGAAEYNMTEGTLNVGSFISLGESWASNGTDTFIGNGTINQSGGTITAGDDLLVGQYGTGTYTMTGGSLSLTGVGSDLIVGAYNDVTGGTYHSIGTFKQYAGSTITVNEHVYVGYNSDGTYTMTGGSLSVTGGLYVGHYGYSTGILNQSGGTIAAADSSWICDYSTSTGTYTLSADAVAIFASDLNVCAAFGYDGTSSPSGTTGTLNIEGEDVTLSVGGNLVATGASIDPTNSSIINFTTGVNDDVSTIDVTGYADIDGAVFDIVESSMVAAGTVLDLIEADGGILNFATASLGSATPSDWSLQLGGSGNILQAVKAQVPEPSSIVLILIGAMMACNIRRRKSI